MTAYHPTMPEAQAMGLCFLARHKGLPDIALLRAAVVQLHPDTCGWCEYDPQALREILRGFRPMAREEADWWKLPRRAKADAIVLAQGGSL